MKKQLSVIIILGINYYEYGKNTFSLDYSSTLFYDWSPEAKDIFTKNYFKIEVTYYNIYYHIIKLIIMIYDLSGNELIFELIFVVFNYEEILIASVVKNY